MSQLQNKYLVFFLEQEQYALPLERVKEVLRMTGITSIHEASRSIKGVIELRGKIIPIIDMKLRLGMNSPQYHDRTVFIITEIPEGSQTMLFGMVVDGVRDVCDLKDDEIDTTAAHGMHLDKSYLKGIAQYQKQILQVLNIDAVLSGEDKEEMARLGHTQPAIA